MPETTFDDPAMEASWNEFQRIKESIYEACKQSAHDAALSACGEEMNYNQTLALVAGVTQVACAIAAFAAASSGNDEATFIKDMVIDYAKTLSVSLGDGSAVVVRRGAVH